MRYLHFILSILLGILALSGCGGEEEHDSFQESSEQEANIVFAEESIMFLSEGQFDKATEYFDETMKEDLPAKELENVWSSLEKEFGSFQKQQYQKTEKVSEEYEIVLLEGSFEKGNVIFQVTLDQDEHIAGFYILEPTEN